VLSVAGIGILAGSLIMSVWGGPKRRVYGVLGSTLLSGACMILAGLAPSAILIGAMAFFFALGTPISAACSQAIWQRKVAPDVQGRVFGIRAMIAMSALPLAYVISGPLTDYIFNPLLAKGGPLADSVGLVIGSGPGRGIGLFFILLGFLTIVAVIAGVIYPRLRLVEEELPDAIVDQAPAEAAPSAQDLASVQPQLESV
jgi:MFS family permease